MNKTKIYSSLFITSFTLFIYELFVSRIFSVILSNQFSYLVISFSILGLGIGGIVVHYLAPKRKFKITYLITGYIITYLLTISAILLLPHLGSPIWYTLLGIIPFVFGGGIVSYFFKIQSDSFRVYFYDLIGGVTGLIAGMLLMNYLGTIRAIVFSYVLVILIALFTNYPRKIKITLTILIGILLLGSNQLGSVFSNNFNSFLTSPYVGYADGSVYKYSDWNSFARTDVAWVADKPDQMLVGLNGRSFSRVIKYDGNLEKINFLKDEIGYFPMEVGNAKSIAIIGAGGGEEILYSFLAGIDDITAIEINRASVEAMSALKDFTGDIYKDPRVKTVIGDGRSFLRNTDRKYDEIYLSLVMTNIGDNVANTLTENYIYTEEALGDYFAKLNPGGQLSFMFHSSTDLLKMLLTSISYLNQKGVMRAEIPDHFVIVMEKDTYMFPVMIVRAEPFSKAEALMIAREVEKRGLLPINTPFLNHEQTLHNYSHEAMPINKIVKEYPLNIAPINDNRPFFYNAEKTLPRSLVVLLTGALVLALGAYLVGMVSKKKKFGTFTNYFLIFSFLGMAFMFIEITLIQKLAVFLEHPVNSFVLVIAVLLTGAGISNLIQSRKGLFTNYKPILYLVGLGVVGIVLLNKLIYQEGIDYLWLKFVLATLVLLPLGFLMGIPFPMALKNLQKDNQQRMIPFFWGINGIGSVMGSALTLILSLKVGFNLTYIIGIFIYLLTAFFIKSVLRN